MAKFSPNQIATRLRRIAAFIDSREAPSRSAVLSVLRRVAEDLEPEFVQDVQRLMESGLPATYDAGDPSIIRSNYPLSDADIFITYPTGYGDHAVALVVFPDVDILIEFDSHGHVMSHQSSGQLAPEDVGVSDLASLKSAASPGSLMDPESFASVAKEHGYYWESDWSVL